MVRMPLQESSKLQSQSSPRSKPKVQVELIRPPESNMPFHNVSIECFHLSSPETIHRISYGELRL